MSKLQRRTFSSALLGMGLTACASVSVEPAPDAFVAADFASPAKRALILHLHVPSAESGYREGDVATARLVRDALTGSGYRVGIVAYEDYAVALMGEFDRLLRSSRSPSRQQIAEAEGKALALLANVACAESQSPLLIRTRLTTRSAKLWQSFAYWDGQKRQIKFLGTDSVKANIEGSAPGISVEAVAMDPAGRLVVKNYGGVTLPFVAGSSPVQRYDREDLFRDEKELSEGVSIALGALRK